MSLLSEFEATPQKGTVGSHMRKNKQQIEMIHINDIRPNKLNFFHINEEDVKSLADELETVSYTHLTLPTICSV